ncbi:MAG: hypothetical protein ACXVB1_15425 [Pseudobdellovibrionaceae bacterium]
MNNSMKNSVFFMIMFLSSLMGCSPQTASMTASKPYAQPTPPTFPTVPEQKAGWITEDGGQSQLNFNPQVDILFLTDNSDSMKSAQENLVHNIDKFADGIVKNKMVDYHIGVVSTWDSSERFLTTKKDPYSIGELRFIKDSKNQTLNKRFVSRAESDLMASTLNIGVASYADGGPEKEEFFSPLLAALQKSSNGGPNDGFFRPDAHLVAIFLTDADDSSADLTSDEVDRRLMDFKGGRRDKISVYGVLVNADDKDEYKDWDLRIHPKYHPECFNMTKKTPTRNGRCTKGFGPDRLEQLIVTANQGSGLSPKEIRQKYIMSIISKNFGSDLATIGSDIKIKTMAKEIFLSQIPVINEHQQVQVRVRYGTPDELAAGHGQLIPQSPKGGWLYNPEKNSVRLSGDINYQYKEGARFAVDLMPVILK